MPAKRLAARHPDDATIIVVPIPLAVAHAIGCRPNAVVCLHIVDGEIRVAPDTAAPFDQKSSQNAASMWESYHRWWNERGSNSGKASAPRRDHAVADRIA